MNINEAPRALETLVIKGVIFTRNNAKRRILKVGNGFELIKGTIVRMFIPKNSIQLVVPLLVLLLSGCLTEDQTTETSSFYALRNGVNSSVRASVKRQRALDFPPIDEDSLSGPTKLRSFLKLRFSRNKPFSLTRVRFALNGLKGKFPLKLKLDRLGQWAKVSGHWELLVDLSEIRFGGELLLARVSKIQRRNGTVSIWIGAPFGVETAELFFVDSTHVDPVVEPSPPQIIGLRISPEGAEISQSSVSAYFSAEEAKKFYCALDSKRFRKCSSPQHYRHLSLGNHSIRVFAVSRSGRKGPVETIQFKRISKKVAVNIVKVDPEASPTPSDSIEFKFETKGKKVNPWKERLYYFWKKHCQYRWKKSHVCQWLGKKVRSNYFVDRSQALCRLDDGEFFKCESPVTFEGLAQGAHEFSVKPQNGGNEQGDSYAWSVDSIPPTLEWGELPTQTQASQTLTLRFNANESSRFECALNNSAYESCSSPLTYENMAEGPYQVSVRAFDLAGNVSKPISFSGVIDGTELELEIVSVNPPERVTSSTQMSISFSASKPVAQYFCALDGLPEEENHWELCESPYLIEDLSEGDHELFLMGEDESGNRSEPISYAWHVDTVQPELSLLLVSPASIPTNSPSATFSFEADEASTFTCSVSGTLMGPCVSPITLEGLTEGNPVFQVTATDTAGNEQTRSFNWEIDQTPPEITLGDISPSENPTLTRTLQVNFSVSEAGSVQCNLNQLGWSDCQSPYQANELADGTHSLQIRATDHAGNATTANLERTVYSPAVVAIDTVDPAESSTPLNVATFTFSSLNANQWVCALDSETPEPCESPVVLSSLSDGDHTFYVYGIDLAGEAGTPASHQWRVDTGPLALTNVSVSNVTSSAALITWTSSLPATSQVAFGIGNLDEQSQVDVQYVSEHSVILTGLNAFSFYSFEVISVDQLNRESRSQTLNFRTLP